MPIADFILSQITSPSPELKADSASLEVFALDDYDFISVAGPDAEKFLQGQGTCDFRRLQQADLLRGAHCNAKGRMISSFIVSLLGGAISLRVHKSIGQKALDALKKYSVFSKVTLTLMDDMAAFVVAGAGAARAIEKVLQTSLAPEKFIDLGAAAALCYDAELVEVRGQREFVESCLMQLKQEGVALTANPHWDSVLVARGWPEIRAEISEEYIPQMLNFHLIDAVSFKKGCYTGQEIVARMQYLGKLKKHLYAGSVAIPQGQLQNGEQLVAPAGGGAQGEIVLYAAYADRTEFLAVVNDAAVGSEALHLGNLPEAKIAWRQLPYAIP